MSAAVLWVGLTVAVAVCCWLSWIDVRERRLPNRIVAPLAAAVTIWLVALGIVEDDLSHAVFAVVIGLALSLVAAVIGLATSAIGMGDAKLLAPVAATLAWLGNQATTAAVAAMAIAIVIAAGWALLRGDRAKTRVPFGPVLTCGLIAGVVGFGFPG